MQQTSVYVDKFYEMDPEHEDLIGEGCDLKDGMIVLLEDSFLKQDTRVLEQERPNEYDMDRLRENNRWCTISQLKVRQRFEYNEHGTVIGEGSPLVSFVAIYADGTKKKRTFDSSYAWFVKKESM